MGNKSMNITAWILGAIFTFSPNLCPQVNARSNANQDLKMTAPARVEPLRVVNGQMRGRTVAGHFFVKGRRSEFSFSLSKAEIVGATLQLTGTLSIGRNIRTAQKIKARIAGSMAKASNPWPRSSDDAPKPPPKADSNEQKQGREAKNAEAAGQLGQLAQSTQNTARKSAPAPGEKTEQSQSPYDQAESVIGCGVLFLSLDLPPSLRVAMGAGTRPVQLGVVLAQLDNQLGEEINRRICAVLRMTADKPGDTRLAASITELNRLLASSK